MLDVVCIGAHPDDVELGMGGTVAAMVRNGLRVGIVDLTNGEPTPHGDAATRAREAKRAAGILGVERRTLDLPNRYLMDGIEARCALAAVVREWRPSVVFAPYPVDAHPDHVAAASLAMAARFYAKLTKTDLPGQPHHPRALFSYVAIHLPLHIKPAFVHALEPSDVERKLEAIRAYRSQFIDNPANAHVLDEVARSLAYWGSRIGGTAGEPFVSLTEIGIRAITDLV